MNVMNEVIEFDPELDGVTHINVYSRGATLLGRKLSNFSLSPFECSDGQFNSIEAYWYWLLSTSTERDNLRLLHGIKAKKEGRKYCDVDYPSRKDMTFRLKILVAIYLKVKNDLYLQYLMKESTLPFVHYYDYGGKIVVPDDNDWIMKGLEIIRTKLINGTF